MNLLTILNIVFFTSIISAKSINVTSVETENDSPFTCDCANNQFESLQIDVLKLRQEMMELQIEKLTHYITKFDQKFQSVLKSQPENRIITNIEDFGDNSLISSEKYGHAIEQSASKEREQSQTESIFMTNINGKEDTKICSTNADKGLTCSDITLPTSCSDTTSKACSRNKCFIQNSLYGCAPFWVSCNDTVDDGGWIVIQRRLNGSVDFQRGWNAYKRGFGDLDGEFWIGLEKMYSLTNTLAPVELLVELVDFDGVAKYAKYDFFTVGDEESKYPLNKLGSYSGDAGDSLSYHANMKFSTRDNDSSDGCANIRDGAWWYNDCTDSNLNGRYFKAGTKPVPGDRNGVNWYKFHDADYSFKAVQMMIRPRKL